MSNFFYKILSILLLLLNFANHCCVYATESFDINNSVSILLLVDNSGSMRITDPHENRIAGSETVLNFLSTGDQAGIVTFADNIQSTVPLTIIKNFQDRYELLKSFKKNEIGNNTRIDLALEKALNLFTSSKYNNKAIILLSDGAIDVDGSPFSDASRQKSYELLKNTLPKLKSAGIKIYTISLSNKAADANSQKLQQELMSSLANQTGGRYIKALTSFDLHKSFIDVLKELTDPPKLLLNKLDKGYSFQVDPSVKRVNIIVDKKSPSDKDIKLLFNGKAFNSSLKDKIIWTKSLNTELITLLETPERGLWKIISSSGSEFNAEVWADTDYKLVFNDVKGNLKVNQNLVADGFMLYRKSDSEPFKPVERNDCLVSLLIKAPDKKQTTVEAKFVGNGLYKSRFKPDVEGIYSLKFFSKGNIERQSSEKTFYVAGKSGSGLKIFTDHNVYALGERINVTVISNDVNIRPSKDFLSLVKVDGASVILPYKLINNRYQAYYATQLNDLSGEYYIIARYINKNKAVIQQEAKAYVIGRIGILNSAVKYGLLTDSGLNKALLKLKSDLTLTTFPVKLRVDDINFGDAFDNSIISFNYPQKLTVKGQLVELPFDLSYNNKDFDSIRPLLFRKNVSGSVVFQVLSLSGDVLTSENISVSFAISSLAERYVLYILVFIAFLASGIWFFLYKKRKRKFKSAKLFGKLSLKGFPPLKTPPKQKEWDLSNYEKVVIGSSENCDIALVGLESEQVELSGTLNKGILTVQILSLSSTGRSYLNGKSISSEFKYLAENDKLNLNGYIFTWQNITLN